MWFILIYFLIGIVFSFFVIKITNDKRTNSVIIYVCFWIFFLIWWIIDKISNQNYF